MHFYAKELSTPFISIESAKNHRLFTHGREINNFLVCKICRDLLGTRTKHNLNY